MIPLEDIPDPYASPSDPVAREAWRVTGLGTFTWVMDKLAELAARRAEIQEVHDRRVQAIDEWAAEEDRKLADDVSFFEARAIEWALEQRRLDPDRRTFAAPGGKVETRTVGCEWTLDETVALAWAKRCRPELVRVKPAVESFALSEAKRLLEVTDEGLVLDPDNKEIVDGIRVGPAWVKATVKVTVPKPSGAAS